jgi:hypothetical protein
VILHSDHGRFAVSADAMHPDPAMAGELIRREVNRTAGQRFRRVSLPIIDAMPSPARRLNAWRTIRGGMLNLLAAEANGADQVSAPE